MSGDYSRVRFDPSLDLSGVLMQQGRVQLDSDWNEWVAVLERRLRAESVDTFGVQLTPGITGVAVVSPQTPDAFKIEAAGGNITIGRGRMYVDGLLAENHRYSTPENDDYGAAEFDPVLAELRGKDPLPYDKQPYLPAPPGLPTAGVYLAYLEVWQRELTYLEHPELVEQAVGVDTTARLQTVWQVRLLGNVGDANCTTPDNKVPEWQALIIPSAGRLSIKAEGVPPDLDPCELPPSGGYRGLENQLYRIEIHDGGAVGAATFKWSRDNASVASAVSEIVDNTATSTELKLASLGRDAVLRFNTGDWVEILDDRRELSGESGNPALRRGVMRKITVDDDKRTISFSPALPADLIPLGGTDTLATRHTRVKRWDQEGTVRDTNNNVIVDLDTAGSTGLIPVPAAGVWVVLENGIQVQFSLDPASGGFHCGDYWVSAARSADASVETYTQAPPRGIHRHYARLSIVTFPDTETDCRVHWPPVCGSCCTYTVGDGKKSRGHFNSIQDAVKALPTEGGRICVLPGTHYANVELQERLNIHISGCGLQTVIFPVNGRMDEPIFQIDSCIGIQLCNLTLVQEKGAAIEILDTKQASREIIIEKNHIIAGTRAIGITSKNSDSFTNAVRIIENDIAMLNMESGEAAIFTAADDVLIEGNLIVVVPQPDKALTDNPEGVHLLLEFAKTARESYLLKINFNYLASGGIQIAGGSELVTIRGNRIAGGSGNGITLGNIPIEEGKRPSIFIKELSLASKAYLEENAIPFIYDITIEENNISYMGLSGIAPPVFFKPGIIDMMPSVVGLTVYRNRIEHCLLQLSGDEDEWTANAAGFGGIVLMGCESVLILENRIEDNGSDQPKAVCGILIFYSEKIDISDNRILNNGARVISDDESGRAGIRGGIVMLSTFAYLAHALYAGKEWLAPDGIPAIKVHDNIITQPLGQALFLMALGPVSVTGNHLTSQGADFKANPLALLAGTVFILNLGISKDLMMLTYLSGFKDLPKHNIDTVNVAMVQAQADENAWMRYLYMPSGTVMFSNNQVLLDLRNPDDNFPLSSQLIASLDDVAYCSNQSECSSLSKTDTLITDAAIYAVTQRCNDNRFQEGFTLTENSLFSYGFMNTAMGNQATHCLQVLGNSNFVTEIGNNVLLNTDCPKRRRVIAEKYGVLTAQQ
jgi:hypothetical protein